jgi:hypothetical protein
MPTNISSTTAGEGHMVKIIDKQILIDKIITFVLAGLPLFVFVHILYRVLQGWL